MGRSCLNRDANALADGSTPCKIVTAAPAGACNCDAAQGLSDAPEAIKPALLEELESVGYCSGGVSCSSLCLCELAQLKDADLAACQTAADPPDVPGFCYLNAVPGEVHAGDPALDAEQAMETVGMTENMGRAIRGYSKGMRQRTKLAQALVHGPQVLFLDEPTASLDPAATQAVEAFLDHIHRTGTKIIMTTHDLGQARRLADEVLFLHHGRLVEYAPATAFFNNPQSKEAAAFLAGKLLW